MAAPFCVLFSMYGTMMDEDISWSSRIPAQTEEEGKAIADRLTREYQSTGYTDAEWKCVPWLKSPEERETEGFLAELDRRAEEKNPRIRIFLKDGSVHSLASHLTGVAFGY